MINKVSTKIQSRLRRKGLVISLLSIKKYLVDNTKNISNITDDETNKATDYFMQQSIKLTVIEDVDTVSIQSVDITNATSDNTVLANTTSELVASSAGQMGIVLDASEISLIAENINDFSSDLDSDLDAIKSAIMAFVTHKASVNQAKINSFINEVRDVVINDSNKNSQLLGDGLRSINNDLQQTNRDFKSQVTKALAAFKISA
jgi:hypothetical protein